MSKQRAKAQREQKSKVRAAELASVRSAREAARAAAQEKASAERKAQQEKIAERIEVGNLPVVTIDLGDKQHWQQCCRCKEMVHREDCVGS